MKNFIKVIGVIGFHHKKGSQLEFLHPRHNSSEEDELQFPDKWRFITSIAIPDGAHNTQSDFVYFTAPDLDESQYEAEEAEEDDDGRSRARKCLFGVACYRQVNVKDLSIVTADVTRNTVIKSVIVLSTVPLFGMIASLLQGITQSYFDIGDFAQTDVFVESFRQLNEHVGLVMANQRLLRENTFKFTSIAQLVQDYEHETLLLIKAVLLNARILFCFASASQLSVALCSLLSVFPRMMPHGLANCLDTASCFRASDHDDLDDADHNDDASGDAIVSSEHDATTVKAAEASSGAASNLFRVIKSSSSNLISSSRSLLQNAAAETSPIAQQPERQHEDLQMTSRNKENKEKSGRRRPHKTKSIDPDRTDFLTRLHLRDAANEWGFPLAVFSSGMMFAPYLNLGSIELLEDARVRGFLAGTNNLMLQSKHDLFHILVRQNQKSAELADSTSPSSLTLRGGGGGDKSGALRHHSPIAQHRNMKLIEMNLSGVAISRGGRGGEAASDSDATQSSNKARQFALTPLDRRFMDYLLRVVKSTHQMFSFPSSSPSSRTKAAALASVSNNANLPQFDDVEQLEQWLRNRFEDYFKAALLNADFYTTTARQSQIAQQDERGGATAANQYNVEDFGVEFLTAFAETATFHIWRESVARGAAGSVEQLRNQPGLRLQEMVAASASPLSEEDAADEENHSSGNANGNANALQIWQHPGRIIEERFGDTLPGYYQMRNIADQGRQALLKNVSELKKIGIGAGTQIKSSMNTSFSKLSSSWNRFQSFAAQRVATSSSGTKHEEGETVQPADDATQSMSQPDESGVPPSSSFGNFLHAFISNTSNSTKPANQEDQTTTQTTKNSCVN